MLRLPAYLDLITARYPPSAAAHPGPHLVKEKPMKRTAAVVGALGLTLGLGAGAATANAQVVPAPAAAEATPEVLPGQVGTGSMVIDTIERAANEEDAAGAIMTATGEMTVEGLR